MKSTTEKLPQGRSYPLKPSKLASAVDGTLRLPVELTRWDKFDAVMKAQFFPSGEWPGKDGEFFWISCKAVPSEQVSAVRDVLERDAIPELVEWAKSIEAQDARSPIRREKQTFTFSYPPLDG